eukprot:6318883-Alexandrium_andersonii.AAC.1
MGRPEPPRASPEGLDPGVAANSGSEDERPPEEGGWGEGPAAPRPLLLLPQHWRLPRPARGGRDTGQQAGRVPIERVRRIAASLLPVA